MKKSEGGWHRRQERERDTEKVGQGVKENRRARKKQRGREEERQNPER